MQDYAGLKVDLTADPPQVTLRPCVPGPWPAMTVRSRIGNHPCLVDLTGDLPVIRFTKRPPRNWKFHLEGLGKPATGTIEVLKDSPDGWDFGTAWR